MPEALRAAGHMADLAHRSAADRSTTCSAPWGWARFRPGDTHAGPIAELGQTGGVRPETLTVMELVTQFPHPRHAHGVSWSTGHGVVQGADHARRPARGAITGELQPRTAVDAWPPAPRRLLADRRRHAGGRAQARLDIDALCRRGPKACSCTVAGCWWPSAAACPRRASASSARVGCSGGRPTAGIDKAAGRRLPPPRRRWPD